MPQTPCPNCEAQLEMNPEWAGRKMSCPVCKHVFTISIPDNEPPALGEIPEPETTQDGLADSISVWLCPGCHMEVSIPASSAGRMVACPGCQSRFRAPLPEEAGSEPTSAPRQLRYQGTEPFDFDDADELYRRSSRRRDDDHCCHFCGTTEPPVTRTKISETGWILYFCSSAFPCALLAFSSKRNTVPAPSVEPRFWGPDDERSFVKVMLFHFHLKRSLVASKRNLPIFWIHDIG